MGWWPFHLPMSNHTGPAELVEERAEQDLQRDAYLNRSDATYLDRDRHEVVPEATRAALARRRDSALRAFDTYMRHHPCSPYDARNRTSSYHWEDQARVRPRQRVRIQVPDEGDESSQLRSSTQSNNNNNDGGSRGRVGRSTPQQPTSGPGWQDQTPDDHDRTSTVRNNDLGRSDYLTPPQTTGTGRFQGPQSGVDPSSEQFEDESGLDAERAISSIHASTFRTPDDMYAIGHRDDTPSRPAASLNRRPLLSAQDGGRVRAVGSEPTSRSAAHEEPSPYHENHQGPIRPPAPGSTLGPQPTSQRWEQIPTPSSNDRTFRRRDVREATPIPTNTRSTMGLGGDPSIGPEDDVRARLLERLLAVGETTTGQGRAEREQRPRDDQLQPSGTANEDWGPQQADDDDDDVDQPRATSGRDPHDPPLDDVDDPQGDNNDNGRSRPDRGSGIAPGNAPRRTSAALADDSTQRSVSRRVQATAARDAANPSSSAPSGDHSQRGRRDADGERPGRPPTRRGRKRNASAIRDGAENVDPALDDGPPRRQARRNDHICLGCCFAAKKAVCKWAPAHGQTTDVLGLCVVQEGARERCGPCASPQKKKKCVWIPLDVKTQRLYRAFHAAIEQHRNAIDNQANPNAIRQCKITTTDTYQRLWDYIMYDPTAEFPGGHPRPLSKPKATIATMMGFENYGTTARLILKEFEKLNTQIATHNRISGAASRANRNARPPPGGGDDGDSGDDGDDGGENGGAGDNGGNGGNGGAGDNGGNGGNGGADDNGDNGENGEDGEDGGNGEDDKDKDKENGGGDRRHKRRRISPRRSPRLTSGAQ